MKTKVKTIEEKEVKQEAISTAKLVDRYGQLKEQENEIKKEMEKIRELLLIQFTMEGTDRLLGDEFEAKVIKSVRTELVPSKVLKYINQKHFDDVFTVRMEGAKKHLTLDTIEKCIAEVKETTSLSVKRLK